MRGSVVYVNLPPPRGGDHVQAGRRPAVVIHANESYEDVPVVLVVPGTSKLGALRFPHTVRVEPTSENGLVTPTVFMGFQLRAVDKRIIQTPTVGQLEPADLEALEAAIRGALGFLEYDSGADTKLEEDTEGPREPDPS